jgi:hypothetical protein
MGRSNDMVDEIKDAIDIGDFSPTEWEAEFVESIGDHLDSGRTLTEAQEEKLQEIHSKAFG